MAGTLAFAWLAVPTSPVRAQVVNGSFEPATLDFTLQSLAAGSTAIPGWTVTEGGVQWYQGGAFQLGTSWGACYVDVVASGNMVTGSIQQVVPTVAGHHYQVTFELGSCSRYPKGSAVVWVGAAGLSQAATIDAGTSIYMVWQPQVFDFVADADTATLRFWNAEGGSFHFGCVDAVAIVDLDATTPVRPASWGSVKVRYR
jgi:hypothetical protein